MDNVININDYRKEELFILILENGETVGIGKELIEKSKPPILTDLVSSIFEIRYWIDFINIEVSKVNFLIRNTKELKETLEDIGIEVELIDI